MVRVLTSVARTSPLLLLAQQQRHRVPAVAQALFLGINSCSNGSVRRFSSADGSSSKDKILDQARKWQRQKPEEKALNVRSVQIDRSALKQPGAYPGRITSEEMMSKKSKENDLVQVIRTMIEVKGPLTVSEFMQRVRSCLIADCLCVNLCVRG